MTPQQKKLALELITNPPPGSKLAEAKEWGVDLTLLYSNLERTPTQRAQSFASMARSFEALRGAANKSTPDE